MAPRQIATEIVLGGEKEFNSAMTAINSNLKTLRTDMAATSAEFDGNADSIDALTAKQKILAETAAQNDAKVDALRQRYEHLKATLGEDAAATDKAKQVSYASSIRIRLSHVTGRPSPSSPVWVCSTR